MRKNERKNKKKRKEKNRISEMNECYSTLSAKLQEFHSCAFTIMHGSNPDAVRRKKKKKNLRKKKKKKNKQNESVPL